MGRVLQKPWILEVWQEMQQSHILPAELPLPRSKEELIYKIAQAKLSLL